MTEIKIEGMEEFKKKLDNLVKMKKVNASIAQAALFLSGKLKEYPRESHRPNPLIKLDARVRRGFFWHLHNDPDMQVPYIRKKELGHKWTFKVENGGFRAVIGNNTSYARQSCPDRVPAGLHQCHTPLLIAW